MSQPTTKLGRVIYASILVACIVIAIVATINAVKEAKAPTPACKDSTLAASDGTSTHPFCPPAR
jgi:hypothetical protein